ncbi:MAG: RhuM family protein [Bacillota bacterium]
MLTQLEMSELFQTSKQNISLHVKNVMREGELRADSVVKEDLTTAADGKHYRTLSYNLEMILAVGYRVRSARGTRECLDNAVAKSFFATLKAASREA